jgi:cytochrome c-type biogenesis protein CcmF
MENLGALALLLAFCFAIYALLGSVIGKLTKRPFLIQSGQRAVYTVWLLVTVGAGVLIYSIMQGDYRLAYVWETSNKTMPVQYKFAAWWGGQAGSLLFWSWLLATYSAVVTFQNRRKFREMMPYVIGVLMSVQTFFLILNTFVASPFRLLMAGKGVVDLGDGQGLNPLLQYWTMVIHPPMLYLGYVGFAVPFAFAMGSLITKQPGEEWIKTTRRWTLVTWLFQSCGIVLGSAWAYAVLGWGGYWAWDPVENASLLPWITGTAFLHSVMMQEKKGMMKVWNMVLVSSTFLLCIFGTFLTRSGIVQSVHAFASSPIGPWFSSFLALATACTVFLILSRLDFLKSESELQSVLSRESSFMFNNLVLLASCFSILWGTLFPVITEAVMGEKISVDKPFFDRVNIPIALFLLLLTGIGPLIAWRKSSFDSLKRAFRWPTILGVATAVILIALGMRHPYALVSFALCAFVLTTVIIEFWKGSSAISAKSGQNLISAMIELTHRNTRRYGGYLVHVGIVIMFIGFTGAAFNQSKTVELAQGESTQLGAYTIKVIGYEEGEESNQYRWDRVIVDLSKNGEHLSIEKPERRFFIASQTPTTDVALRRRLNEDVYINFAGTGAGSNVVMQTYIFPLVSWIWIGFLWVLGGTLVCLVPDKKKLVFPRMEVLSTGVGTNVKPAKV